MERAVLIIAITCLVSGCKALEKSSTPAPHAFILYQAPKPGDKSLKVGIKDLIDVKDQITTSGSEYFVRRGKPAQEDAECLRHVRRKGVTIVGKNNLSEFAIGVSGCNDSFGTPLNPLDPKRVPGGSSSGSAVAVALGLADVSIGTDTAGSIRVPAACCGVAGLKTTYGRISIKGVYPISPTYLDTVGPMARDVKGLVQGMELLDPGFAGEYAQAKARKPVASKIRVGRLKVPGTDTAIEEAIDRQLAEQGFQVVPLGREFLLAWQRAQRDGNSVAAAASWITNKGLRYEKGVSIRARFAIWFGDLVFYNLFDDEPKRRHALARRAIWREILRLKLEEVDAIAVPVLKKEPPGKYALFVGLFEGRFFGIQNTVAVNYAGVPALALPVPLPDGHFPVTSVQFIGPPDSEAALLNIGRLFEKKLPRRPGSG